MSEAKQKKKKLQLNYLAPPNVAGWVESIFDGPADLDCCAHPQQFIKAAHHCYGGPGDDDGLHYNWGTNTVILNPSNGEKRPVDDDKKPIKLDFAWHPLSKWVSKAYFSYLEGASVLAILPACTDNKRWFHTYIPEASGVVLLRERIKSYVPGPQKNLHDEGEPVPLPQPNQAHMMALWTKDPQLHGRFMQTLGPQGIALSFQVPDGYHPEDFED